MTVLDEIIDASTDSAVTTADLLRKVQIVAHRLGASEVVRWAKSELTGYADDAELPTYRIMQTSVMGTFTGPMQSVIQQHLTPVTGRLESMWAMEFRVPLTELQALASSKSDPQREWPTFMVKAYEATGAFRIQYHHLFSAHNVITRQSLLGLLDVVRSKAMEFALELQTDYPDAGAVGGPTISSTPGLSSTVYNVTNNIYGDGSNIATGSHARQRSRVEKGDSRAFLRAVEDLGLTAADASEFVSAVQEEGALHKPRVQGFLNRVRSGALQLGGAIATDTVAASLVELGKGFLGLQAS
jgi:hypothetical protein